MLLESPLLVSVVSHRLLAGESPRCRPYLGNGPSTLPACHDVLFILLFLCGPERVLGRLAVVATLRALTLLSWPLQPEKKLLYTPFISK